MAGKPFAERLPALLDGLRKALPFLKPRLPVPGSAKDPFDSIEDGTSPISDDTEPNAALDLSGQAKAGRGGRASVPGAFSAFLEAFLGSKLLIGIAIGILVFLLALAVVAILVNAPPPRPEAASPLQAGAKIVPDPEGIDILKRLILPRGPDNAARVELERETSRVYTDEDLAAFRTDPAKIDISGLRAANDAEIQALYGTVP